MSALCLMMASVLATAYTSEMQQPEARVKAMFLYNFALFTDWTGTAKTPLVFCVLGEDRLGSEMETLLPGKMVAERSVAFRQAANTGELASCNIIYVGRQARNRIPQIAKGIQGKSILLVSEFPEGGKEGAAINFFVEHNKMRFAVNLQAAANAGVTLRANLLRLARITDENR